MELAPVPTVCRGDAVDLNASLVRHLECRDEAQQRRLAGARLSHERHVSAARHVEGHAVKRGGRGVRTPASAGLLVREVHVLGAHHGRCVRAGSHWRSNRSAGRWSEDARATCPSRQLGEKDVLVAGPGYVQTAFAQPRGEASREGLLKAQAAHLVYVREDLLRRSHEGNMAMVEHHHAVRAERFVHEVGHVDNGAPHAAELLDHPHDGAPTAHVERGRRLVEHQHAGLHGKRAGDGHALALPAGEARRVCLGVALHGNAVQLAADEVLDSLGGEPKVLGAKRHVLLDHAGHDLVLGVLEDQPQLASRPAVGVKVRGTVGEGLLAHKRDLARVWREKPADDRGQRGLSGSVGS